MTTPLMGRQIKITDPYWYQFMFNEIFVEQIYMFTAQRSVPFILDCGSNIGLSIIYFKYLYPEAEIIGFEPDPEIYQLLRQNIEEFSFSNVELRSDAVWKSVDMLAFQPDGSVGGRLRNRDVTDKFIYVQSMRLRDFLNRPIDLLKLDIEGAEYDVIVDCQEFLHHVDYIFIEYHGKPDESQKLHEILEILQLAGFRYHLKDALPIKHPFIKSERNTYYDLQMNIFGFRN